MPGEVYESRTSRLAGLRVVRVEGFPNHFVFYRAVEDVIEIVPWFKARQQPLALPLPLQTTVDLGRRYN
jgi:hypothetical protein